VAMKSQGVKKLDSGFARFAVLNATDRQYSGNYADVAWNQTQLVQDLLIGSTSLPSMVSSGYHYRRYGRRR